MGFPDGFIPGELVQLAHPDICIIPRELVQSVHPDICIIPGELEQFALFVCARVSGVWACCTWCTDLHAESKERFAITSLWGD